MPGALQSGGSQAMAEAKHVMKRMEELANASNERNLLFMSFYWLHHIYNEFRLYEVLRAIHFLI